MKFFLLLSKFSINTRAGNVALEGFSKTYFYADFCFNRYRRKRPKVDGSIFDLALSHTRRSDASEKREKKSVSTFGRFRLWTSFESSPVSVKATYLCQFCGSHNRTKICQINNLLIFQI